MSNLPDAPAVSEAPQKPQKQRKPPSPHIPRLIAALAIITLLAVPVVVPVVVMKMTGKTGRKDAQLADAIEGPEVSSIIISAPEETTQEEIKESFLKLNDNKVGPSALLHHLSRTPRLSNQRPWTAATSCSACALCIPSQFLYFLAFPGSLGLT